MNFVICLPSSLSCNIINLWIDLKDVARLDAAFSVIELRPTLLDLLSSTECVIESEVDVFSYSLLRWLLKRSMKVANFFIPRYADEKLRIQYMEKLGSRVTTIVSEQSRSFYDASVDSPGTELIKLACSYGNLLCVNCHDLSISLLNVILSSSPFLKKLRFRMPRGNQENFSISVSLPYMADFRPIANSNIVMGIISLCPNLKIFDLYSLGTHFTDADLLTVAKKCRHLKSLALRGLRCSVYSYIEVSKHCSGIEVLSLEFVTTTDEVLESIAIHLKQLRRLNLQYCRNLTNISLNHLAAHCTSTLELLWLSGNDGIVVYVHEIPVVKNVLDSIASDVKVIRNDCKENEVASLIVFPL